MRKSLNAGCIVLFVTVVCLNIDQHLLASTSAEVQEWLRAHNTYRTLHGVPAVTWSPELAQKAQEWANTCPSGHSTYGENMLFATFSLSPGDVVARWYQEESLYDYTDPGFSVATGHFTQIVWKNTTAIGCGYTTRCSDKWPYIWVCQYTPPGNVYGEFAANVLPLRPDENGNRNFLSSMLMLLLFK